MRTDARLASARLASAFVIAAALALVVRGQLPAWLLVIPVAAFTALVVAHDRLIRRRDRALRATTFYDHGLARLEDRWHGLGDTGDRFGTDDHLYARDLDIFGPASVFQLLCRARTHLGQEALARWLANPTPLPAVRQRQHATTELRDALDFREALATAGGADRDVDTVALSAWASAPSAPESLWLRMAALVLAAAIVGTIGWWLTGGPLSPLLVVIILKMLLTRPSRVRVARIVRGVERPLSQLDVLADTLALIEQSSFASARLAAIRTEMVVAGIAPSEAIRRLARLADMLDWRRNALFAVVSATVSWPLHLSAAIEQWRRTFGARVLVWLAAIAEYEALSSLAGYAYEHPGDRFPEFVEDGPARFEGRTLGHPLVPADRMVRNDVLLTGQRRLLIVSGSNMSGKSTLLRTVGVNAVLAMAGAPVRADALVMTPLRVGATLHVHDSLQAGRSRFFAEISRIRQIADLVDETPHVLFLIDELFQGTNSHDRRIGAEALLRSLIARGAIGLTTTHDLALTVIADMSDGAAGNVHFEDQLKDGELVFDYRMKPGPVTHSNALALMKAVGLPVDTIGRLTD